jgi:hypothetical protein
MLVYAAMTRMYPPFEQGLDSNSASAPWLAACALAVWRAEEHSPCVGAQVRAS